MPGAANLNIAECPQHPFRGDADGLVSHGHAPRAAVPHFNIGKASFAVPILGWKFDRLHRWLSQLLRRVYGVTAHRGRHKSTSRLHRLGDDRQLQIGRKPPPSSDAGDPFHFENVPDIGISLGLSLGPAASIGEATLGTPGQAASVRPCQAGVIRWLLASP